MTRKKPKRKHPKASRKEKEKEPAKQPNTKTEYFQHEPLSNPSEEIRLLTISSAISGSTRVTLKAVPIAQATKLRYRCLSYTWGTSNTDQPAHLIHVDGKPCHVGSNLYEFLHCSLLRSQPSPQFWWIDALCIDQSNFVERDQQVQLMGTIYQQAVAVVSWLGKSDIPPELKLELAHISTGLVRQREQEMSSVYSGMAPLLWSEGGLGKTTLGSRRYQDVFQEALYSSAHERLNVQPNHTQTPVAEREIWYSGEKSDFVPELIAISNGLTNDYWERAWIVQEVQLARINYVWCDGHQFDLEALACMYDLVSRLLAQQTQIAKASRMMADLLARDSPMKAFMNRENAFWRTRPLINVLRNNANTKCRELHDQIYAFRSLATEGPLLDVRYDSSRTSLFLRCLRACSDRFCFCSAPFLFERLKLRNEPDDDIQTLITHTSISSCSCYLCAEAFLQIVLPYAPGTWDRIAEARGSTSETGVVTTCNCQASAWPKSWVRSDILIVCLTRVLGSSRICGLNDNNRSGLHLLFKKRMGVFQGVKFAESRKSYGEVDEIIIREAASRYWLDIDNNFDLDGADTAKDRISSLKLSFGAFLQMLNLFGASKVQCLRGGHEASVTQCAAWWTKESRVLTDIVEVLRESQSSPLVSLGAKVKNDAHVVVEQAFDSSAIDYDDNDPELCQCCMEEFDEAIEAASPACPCGARMCGFCLNVLADVHRRYKCPSCARSSIMPTSEEMLARAKAIRQGL